MQVRINPTVGRVMLFCPAKDDAIGKGLESHERLAAVVAYVHNDALVNLTVFSREGIPSGFSKVPVVQADEVIESGARYCHWMPYQIGQASVAQEVAQTRPAEPAAIGGGAQQDSEQQAA